MDSAIGVASGATRAIVKRAWTPTFGLAALILALMMPGTIAFVATASNWNAANAENLIDTLSQLKKHGQLLDFGHRVGWFFYAFPVWIASIIGIAAILLYSMLLCFFRKALFGKDEIMTARLMKLIMTISGNTENADAILRVNYDNDNDRKEDPKKRLNERTGEAATQEE